MNAKDFHERLKAKGIEGIIELVEGAGDEGSGDDSIRVEPERLPEILEFLKSDSQCLLDQLSLVSGTHYEDRFECVYHLLSIGLKHDLVIKAHLDKDDPRAPSVAAVHPTADWHERETYDLVGIHFDNHPDLRRIYLPEGWEGHPLRRDYVDPTEFEGIPLTDVKRAEAEAKKADAIKAEAEKTESTDPENAAESGKADSGKEGGDKPATNGEGAVKNGDGNNGDGKKD